MSHYDKLLFIISKWPLNEISKQFNYGYHLRQLLKDKNIAGNVFPGSASENSEMLASLQRLVSNVYKNKYPTHKTVGATKLPLKELKGILSEEFLEYYTKNKQKFFR